jgi:primosomal protein N' (replication factor Y)
MNPHHYAIRLALEHDYHGFFAEELAVREALNFPPFTRLVEITAAAAVDERARQAATDYAQALRDNLAQRGAEAVVVLGPSPAFIHRLRGEYRWSITIKARDLAPVMGYLPDGRGFSVDVDPL